MFTGLVRDVGTLIGVTEVNDGQRALRLTISSKLPLPFFEIGASVACNGVCLTVVDAHHFPDGVEFSVEAGPATLKVTRFGSLKSGALINLEPALRLGDAMGGHILSGHVDALCEVDEMQQTGNGFFRLKLRIAEESAHLVFSKGSLAVAGVSLTLANVFKDDKDQVCAEIMLIPHTLQATNLQMLKKGDVVEVEFDQIAKTVASTLETMLPKVLTKFSDISK